MPPDDIMAFRPKTSAPADIAAARTAVEERLAADRAVEADLTARRGTAFLAGDQVELERIEAGLDGLRRTCTQLETLLPTLATALDDAIAAAEISDLRQQGEQVLAQHDEVQRFALELYPELAGKIIAGLAMERRAIDALHAYRGRLASLPAERRAALPDLTGALYLLGHDRGHLHQSVVLPAVVSDDADDCLPRPFWMAGDAGRIMTGTITGAEVSRRRQPIEIQAPRELSEAEKAANVAKRRELDRAWGRPTSSAPGFR